MTQPNAVQLFILGLNTQMNVPVSLMLVVMNMKSPPLIQTVDSLLGASRGAAMILTTSVGFGQACFHCSTAL